MDTGTQKELTAVEIVWNSSHQATSFVCESRQTPLRNVGAFPFLACNFLLPDLYIAQEFRKAGRFPSNTPHVSQRHSCSVEPQSTLKMTRSICKQGPFSWVLAPRQVKSVHTRWSQLIWFFNRVPLKTVCAVHIPHFAGRKAKVNPVSGAILRRASECAALASETAAFLPLGHNLAGQDSKHDLSNAKGLCPSHPVSQNIESKAWGENLEAVCQVRIEYDERFVARPYGILCTCGFHGAAQTQEEAERVKACHVRLCSRSARGGANGSG